MASITLTIPDALVQRVTDGFCGLHNYRETIPDPESPGEIIPNPETKAAFMRRIILQKIKRDVLEYEGVQAQRAALAAGTIDIAL